MNDTIKKYAILAAIGAGAVFALAYFAKKGVAAVGEVASTKLNPYSDKNVLYDNVIGGAGKALSGDSNWTLGGWIYDVTHSSQAPATAPAKSVAAVKMSGASAASAPVLTKADAMAGAPRPRGFDGSPQITIGTRQPNGLMAW